MGFRFRRGTASQKMNRIELGIMIKQLRAKNNVSQRKLAAMAGVTPASIANIELGKYSVGVDILFKILDALHSDIKITDKAD